MKTIKLFLPCIFCLLYTVNTNAQFLEKLVNKSKKKIEREAEKRTEKRVNKGIEGVFNQAEEGMDSTLKKEKKNPKDKPSSEKTGSELTNSSTIKDSEQPQSALKWTKYDFVPGTEIIFEDNQQNEQNGEFPSKWDLVTGIVENANMNENNVIYFRETGNFPNGIVPLLKDPSADYLPEDFTIEFDAYFEKGKYNDYHVFFYDTKNKSQKKIKNGFVSFYVNSVKYGYTSTEKQLENTKFSNKDDDKSHWRHIAISFNKRALKVYLDETRLLNIPNITDNLTGLTLSVNHANQEKNQFIKNVRIAKGAVPLYEKVLTDGKFITTGIKFDVNKATLKLESMGTINYVVKMMQDNPDWNFCVEGHTDSDGNDASNQSLSEKRAAAVCTELVRQGISNERLTSKGWGESKPMTDNTSSEGKAQNRRVEFVKL